MEPKQERQWMVTTEYKRRRLYLVKADTAELAALEYARVPRGWYDDLRPDKGEQLVSVEEMTIA